MKLDVSLPRLRCQTESTYVQTIPDGSCLCPDFCAFTRLSCVHLWSGHTCFRLGPQPGYAYNAVSHYAHSFIAMLQKLRVEKLNCCLHETLKSERSMMQSCTNEMTKERRINIMANEIAAALVHLHIQTRIALENLSYYR